MRQLKFRAFDKVTKQMSDEFVLFGEYTLMGMIHSWQHECGNTSKTSLEALGDLEVMQFIGLYDRQGVEMYEGDIVRTRGGGISVVEFDMGVFGLNHDYGTDNKTMLGAWGTKTNLRSLDDGYNYDCIVIGDVYRTPELLSQNKC